MKQENWLILSLRTILFFEAFVIIGLVFFWITFVGDRIQNENLFDIIGLIIPLIMVGIVNSWWKSPSHQTNIRKIQPMLNLIIVGIAFSLIIFYQASNWIYFPLSFSWNYGIWWFILGLVLCSLVGFEHTIPYSYEIMKSNKDILFFGILFGISWMFVSFFIEFNRYFSIFLIILMITHSILSIYEIQAKSNQSSRLLQDHNGIENALISIQKHPSTTINNALSLELQKISAINEKYYHRFSKIVAILLAFQLLTSFFYKIFDMNSYLSLEVNWNEIIHFFNHWLLFFGFIVGIGFIVIQVQYKKPGILLGLGLNLLLTTLGWANIYIFAPFICGLTLMMLFWTVTNAKPLLYGILSWFLIIIWLAGFLGGNFLGVFYSLQWIFILGFNVVSILLFGILLILNGKYRKRFLMMEGTIVE